jgi:tetratricopeptide (TPR) repeat protein
VVQACCKNETFVLGEIGRQSLDEIWHGARVGQLRAALTRYAFGAGCEQCEWQIAGGNFHGAYPRIFDDLKVDSAVPQWPAMLEFTVSNTCNFECVMCFGELSSSIRAHRDGLPPLPRVYDDRFFADLRRYLPHLKRAKFFGGEPFLAEECFRIWDQMVADGLATPCHATTNGSTWNERVERILEKLPFSISVSIDGATAATFESIRVNGRFDVVMRNAQRFADYARRRGTGFSIAHCLMRQNWREFFDVLLIGERFSCPVWVNTVVDPSDCSLFTLPVDEQIAVARELEALGRPRLGELKVNRQVFEDEVRNLLDHGLRRRTRELETVQVHREVLRARVEGLKADHVTPAWRLANEGRLDEALAEVDRTRPEDVFWLQSRVARANFLRMAGRLDEAEQQALDCVRAAPRHGEAHVALAWLRLAQHRAAEALTAAQRALELVLRSGSGESAARHAVARALLVLERPGDAMLHLERLVELDPQQAHFHVDRGWALFGLGRVDDADEVAQRVLAADPRQAGALHLRREIAAWHDRQRPPAVVVATAPPEPEVVAPRAPEVVVAPPPDPIALAWTRLAEGRPDEALRSVEQADAATRASPSAQLARARALRLLGRLDEAETQLRECVAATPGRPQPFAELAWVELARGRAGAAERAARDALERCGVDRASEAGARHALAVAAFEAGRFADALAQFERLVELVPDQLSFRVGRGWACARLGRREEALAEARRVLGLEPDHGEAKELLRQLAEPRAAKAG